MIGREDEVRRYRDTVWIVHLFLWGAIAILASRLLYLQVFRGNELRRFSEANRLKKVKLLPTRGVIFDRYGKVIVDNRASFDVILFSQYYKFTPENNKRLAKALQLDLSELEKRLSKVAKTPSYAPILLKADVSKDVIAAIETDTEGFFGVDIEENVKRRYPFEDIAAQVLGYISEVGQTDLKKDGGKTLQMGDYIGRMGLERRFDARLRGENGYGLFEVDAKGRRRETEGAEKVLGYVQRTEPMPGDDLYLTIDMDLELAAAQAMKTRKFYGSVIALDPRNGEILALLNYPSFDPERISGREVDVSVWTSLRDSKDRPLRNRAVQDIYSPGSTFKLFTAIAGLAEGKIGRHSSVHCTGGMQFGNRRFRCWKTHGYIDFVRAIKESCDVFFYQLGNDLGVDKIAEYAKLFGFGEGSGINLSSEQAGLIPSTKWKQATYNDIWHPGETLSVAIGQGYVSVTPMQLANAYAAIANGGLLYTPYLVRRIERRGGEIIHEFHPKLTRKIQIPDKVFEVVREGLFRAVNEQGGTAYGHRSKITKMAGKTGTVQVRGYGSVIKKCESTDYYHRDHGWFVGYAPAENPGLVVATLAEHSCHGTAAAGVVKDVIEAHIRKEAEQSGVPIPEPLERKVSSEPVSMPKEDVE